MSAPYKRELRLTRVLKAPRGLVFEAFTKAEHLVHWWAPKPFTVPSCKVDLRPGGSWDYVFRSPEGLEHPCHAEYEEVDPPARLVMVQGVPGGDGKFLFKVRQVLTLEEREGVTHLVFEVKVIESQPGSEPFLAGMEQGTNMTLDNLVEYLLK